ncbi:MAG: hypothetical protein ACYCWW_04795 [Deltaproteobacteria bacterium]
MSLSATRAGDGPAAESTRREGERLAPPSPWQKLEALAIALAAVFAVGFWFWLPSRLPSKADYEALGRTLASEARPGDGVAFAPFWAERGKLFVHGLPTVALPGLENEPDAERFARLWVVGQPDLPRSDAAATLRALDGRLTPDGARRRFGPLSLSRYTPRAGRATTDDFVAHLGDAEASIGGETREPCQKEPGGQGFVCPRGSWNYIRPEWHEFDFLPRRCLWAHPVGPEPLELDFPGASVAHGFRGGMGLVGQAADDPRLAPVDLAFLVDGALAGEVTLGAGDPGFHPFELDIPGLSAGPHDVKIQVSSQNPARRHFCFDAVAF